MDATGSSTTPDRPGKTSVWTTARAAGKYDGNDSRPDTAGGHPTISALDHVRLAFWQSYRHLFPPHSLAAQTAGGSVVISWSIMDDPHAKYPYAAPVMLRFDDALIETMWTADPRQRIRIAEKHEPLLREGLRGYDPFARFPNARVVVIG